MTAEVSAKIVVPVFRRSFAAAPLAIPRPAPIMAACLTRKPHMPEVTLYSGPYCPYCNMAKALLKQLGVTEIREIRADSEPEAFEAMRRATNTRTVPQIFIGDTHVGGFTDLRALHNAGRLTELLQKK